MEGTSDPLTVKGDGVCYFGLWLADCGVWHDNQTLDGAVQVMWICLTINSCSNLNNLENRMMGNISDPYVKASKPCLVS